MVLLVTRMIPLLWEFDPSGKKKCRLFYELYVNVLQATLGLLDHLQNRLDHLVRRTDHFGGRRICVLKFD